MPHIDANVIRDSSDQDSVSRVCASCGAAMKRLGVLPALSIHAAIRIFRCYGCNHVISEQL